MSAPTLLQINVLHVVVVAPLILYVGIQCSMRRRVRVEAAYALVALGAVALAYHGMRVINALRAGRAVADRVNNNVVSNNVVPVNANSVTESYETPNNETIVQL